MKVREVQDKLIELKIEIYGIVQGVGFRHFVKENADKLNLKGFVMNKDDSIVLIVAQGDKLNLEKLLFSVQRGPFLAKVEGVSYFWKNPENNYNSFIIALDRGFIKDQKRNFLNLGKRFLNIKEKVPKHVAIIPDGNRRWAKGKGLPIFAGHERMTSFDKIVPLLKEAKKLEIKYITFWAFSTENWKRSEKEIDYLFNLITKFSKKFEEYAIENKIRFRHLGRKDRIPKKLVSELEKLEEETKNFNELNVQACLDYGGRDEIIRAINKILKSGVNEITENDFSHYLDSVSIPDPDLVIRTSGEQRTSGFMSFQSAYSELYFADVYFPDFGPKQLREAVEEFARRSRNFGQ